MSDLFKSVNSMTQTENGAISLATSADANVDYFFTVGACRNHSSKAIKAYHTAARENEDTAVRILLWSRDARLGAGERQNFRETLTNIASTDLALANRILVKIPELGRWDDAVSLFLDPNIGTNAMSLCLMGLASENALCAKWMPREKSKWNKQARAFMEFAELTPRLYRKILSSMSNTVEQKMCAQLWSKIDYSHIPSLAAARYQSCFNAKDSVRYTKYRAGLETGETKVNAGAIFPYDVLKGTDAKVMEAQWDALPDFMEGSTASILPMIDVSGSMTWADLGNNLTPMSVAVSLGLYVAERSEGPFKNQYLSFSSTPKFIEVDRTLSLSDRALAVVNTNVGYSTNIQKAFQTVLDAAVRFKLTQEQLPSCVLIFSDMEFDECEGTTNFEAIQARFALAGYKLPQLIFWNLAGRSNAIPVHAHETGTALVSGFSPAILKSILANPSSINPRDMALATVNVPRYDY